MDYNLPPNYGNLKELKWYVDSYIVNEIFEHRQLASQLFANNQLEDVILQYGLVWDILKTELIRQSPKGDKQIKEVIDNIESTFKECESLIMPPKTRSTRVKMMTMNRNRYYLKSKLRELHFKINEVMNMTGLWIREKNRVYGVKRIHKRYNLSDDDGKSS